MTTNRDYCAVFGCWEMAVSGCTCISHRAGRVVLPNLALMPHLLCRCRLPNPTPSGQCDRCYRRLPLELAPLTPAAEQRLADLRS